MKQAKNKTGYLHLNLWKNKAYKTFLVHRLVAEAFIPNPLNLPFINHKNEIKTDNRVENIEWCDRTYNERYGTKRERIGNKNRNGALSKKVYQYSKTGELIAIFPSINEVKRQTGYADSHICKCCTGKYDCAYGYVWRYEEWKN